MADGIKDKVAILGMGCSRFGERWESGAEDLAAEALVECLEDAGIEKRSFRRPISEPTSMKSTSVKPLCRWRWN